MSEKVDFEELGIEINQTPEKYIIEDKEYVRVTKVLDVIAKPEFYRWYGKFGYRRCKQIMENRASFGTRMHRYHERFLKGEDIEVDLEDDTEEMKVSIIKFKDWVSRYMDEVLDLELHVHSDEYGYGGTADCIAKLKLGDGKSKLMLVDWKSGKRIYDNYYLQLAAYLFAYEEMTGRRLDGGCIVRFRDGKADHQCIERDDLKREFSVFLSALNIWRWKHG
jgi:hypothetical protein